MAIAFTVVGEDAITAVITAGVVGIDTAVDTGMVADIGTAVDIDMEGTADATNRELCLRNLIHESKEFYSKAAND